jgi:HD-GYP domain-containing protein (c-di-GMP phosphodiesterase class II)
MKLCLNDMLLAFSNALDYAEIKCERVTQFHGKRVAYYSLLMGKYFHLKEADLDNLLGCAILHDNGMTELAHYYQKDNLKADELMRICCCAGEENIKYLKFYPKVKHVIQYHQEMADGTGPFSKKSYETPLYAQIIHIVDWADVHYDLESMDKDKYQVMIATVNRLRNVAFSQRIADAFIKTVTYDIIAECQGHADEMLRQHMNHNFLELDNGSMLSVCYLFANIIDSKSPFTKSHSLGVANKVLRMSVYYQFDDEKRIHAFFAGAMHDVGKLIIDRDILEKPDRLSEEEFIYIQTHAYYTYQILSEMRLGEIVHWASYHHEKLDGSGYPFGKTAKDLDFVDRLMGCCDIYQALSEKRPYKNKKTHRECIDIMRHMVKDNKIDGSIVEDMDKVFGKEYD